MVAPGAPDPVPAPEPVGDLPTVPAGEPAGRRPRRKRRWYVLGFLAVLLVGIVVATNVMHVPYYLYAPGSVRRTEDLVAVDGDRVHRDDAGTISYTTVSLSQASVWNWATARFDQSADLVPERDVLGDRNPDQNRKENLEMMDVSKQVASVVALRKLGFDVKAKGTGAVVTRISDGSPAAGVLTAGDAIVVFDGKPVSTMEDLRDAIRAHKPGDTVSFEVEPDRSGKRETRTVTLAAAPDDANRPFLGVGMVTRDLQFEYPFTVNIDSGQVGGPSAGLAFTLGLIDVLTPGDLTGGRKVATTGTIELDGHVGPVGGVKQKTFAVKSSGATLFLVPRDEVDEARKYAGDDLKVVPVDTLDDALAAIAANGGNTGAVDELAAANKAQAPNRS